MNKHDSATTEFLDTYQSDANVPVVEYDGEHIAFPNHMVSGYITDEFEKRLVVVRVADRDLARIERRQKLEQFYLVATHSMTTDEQVVYDVTCDIERTRDPFQEKYATYIGAIAIKLQRDNEHAATLVMESHSINWIEPQRDCSFEQIM